MKIKCEERLLKCEDSEAEAPWYPPQVVGRILASIVLTSSLDRFVDLKVKKKKIKGDQQAVLSS